MGLLAVASGKGAPGVTTTALVLAAVWPRRALVAECDPAGGDLVYRVAAEHGGPLDPNLGMLSLAADARRGLSPDQVWPHVQRMGGGLDVLTGIATAEQSAGLTGSWSTLGRAFEALPGADVVADCGRLGADPAPADLMRHAAMVLLVARSTPEQIAQARDRAVALSQRLHGGSPLGLPPIGVLLITDPRRAVRMTDQTNEILSASGANAVVVGALADDPAGAEQLSGRRSGRADKSLLVRSARQVALDLQARLGLTGVG
jgi:hypothetical protein